MTKFKNNVVYVVVDWFNYDVNVSDANVLFVTPSEPLAQRKVYELALQAKQRLVDESYTSEAALKVQKINVDNTNDAWGVISTSEGLIEKLSVFKKEMTVPYEPYASQKDNVEMEAEVRSDKNELDNYSVVFKFPREHFVEVAMYCGVREQDIADFICNYTHDDTVLIAEAYNKLGYPYAVTEQEKMPEDVLNSYIINSLVKGHAN